MNTPVPFDDDAFATLYGQRISDFQLAWSVFLLRFMSRQREVIGELEDLLLLVALTIGPAMADARRRGAGWTDTAGPFAGAAPPPTNAVRLSQMTSVPRETVRRRLQAMAARGWVEQSGPPRREWRLAIGPYGWPTVRRVFDALHADNLRDIARLLGRWDRFARESGWAGLTQPPAIVGGGGPLTAKGPRPG